MQSYYTQNQYLACMTKGCEKCVVAKRKARLGDDSGHRSEGFWDWDRGIRLGLVGFLLSLAQKPSRFMVRENGSRRRLVGGCRL